MSIRAYTGEYLTSPVAVHMGLNWCTHNCFYCFANLNNPDRRANFDDITRFMNNVAQKNDHLKSLPTRLVLAGHPVLASNDSDPFAKSNYQQMLPIYEAFNDLGIPLVFQTRGGEHAIKTVESMVHKSMIYISFTTDREDIRKKAEPGTPTHEQRMDLALAAKAAGHHVVIGLNPYWPEWWDDFERFVLWLQVSGFHHVWFGEIHLNHMQVPNIREKAREDFAHVIEFGQQKKRSDPGVGVALWHLRQAGINVFNGTSSVGGNFWDPYFDLGFPFFPTLEGWFDVLRERANGKPIGFTFDIFNQWADPHPELVETSAFKDYLVAVGRSLRNVGYPDKAYSYKDVNHVLWQIDKFPTRMRHDDIFLMKEGDDLLVDDNGRIMLVYWPEAPSDPTLGRVDIKDCVEVLDAE